jgi:hypothetical protein
LQKSYYFEFFPEVLKRVLSEARFPADAMIRSFGKRGWLQHHAGDGSRLTVKRTVNGQLVRLVSLSRAAYAQVCGDTDIMLANRDETNEE